jgi:hypothetical protein
MKRRKNLFISVMPEGLEDVENFPPTSFHPQLMLFLSAISFCADDDDIEK